MRLLSWNVNGLRNFINYDPFFGCKGAYDQVFALLGADIVCLQELKTPSAQLSKAQATPPGYDAFLSLPASGKGYSGVGTWTRQGTVVAAGAEVGLLGLARGGKEGDEGVGGLARAEDYPPEPEVDADADAADEDDGAAADPADPIDPAELDAEGRTTVVDLSLFVLINVYCPALTNPARAPFRLAFLRALGARVRAMRREGREVVLVGDLNVVARPEDHGEGSLASKQEGFWDHPARKWLDNLLAPKGPLHDVVRRAHPTREGMFTCWDTRTDARASNYGTRIDYILVSDGLLPWVKHADIQPAVRGSDHCPVFVDFHDVLPPPAPAPVSASTATDVDPTGTSSSAAAAAAAPPLPASPPSFLSTLLNPPPLHALPPSPSTGKRKASLPPKACAMFAEGFRERSLREWFAGAGGGGGGKKGGEKTAAAAVAAAPSAKVGEVKGKRASEDAGDGPIDLTGSSPSPPPERAPPPPPKASSSTSVGRTQPKPQPKPKGKAPAPAKTTAKPKAKAGQTKLSSFFSPAPALAPAAAPVPGSSTGKGTRAGQGKGKRPAAAAADADEDERSRTAKRARSSASTTTTTADDDDDDGDLAFARALADRSPSPPPPPVPPSQAAAAEAAKTTWSALLTPVAVPKCAVHGAPCIARTVTKPGPNKGKAFFLCSLPLGPGHASNARATGRLAAEVDRRFKCDFFAWAADVRSREVDARWLAGTGAGAGKGKGVGL